MPPMFALNAIPVEHTPLFLTAAITPATRVPCLFSFFSSYLGVGSLSLPFRSQLHNGSFKQINFFEFKFPNKLLILKCYIIILDIWMAVFKTIIYSHYTYSFTRISLIPCMSHIHIW